MDKKWAESEPGKKSECPALVKSLCTYFSTYSPLFTSSLSPPTAPFLFVYVKKNRIHMIENGWMQSRQENSNIGLSFRWTLPLKFKGASSCNLRKMFAAVPCRGVLCRAGHSLFISRFALRSFFIHGSLSLYCSFCRFSGLLIAQSL